MNPVDLIIAAAKQGNRDGVAALLRQDPSLASATNMFGSQAIHAAHFMGHDDLVHLLLANGVTLDFFLAAELGMLDRVEAELNAEPARAAVFSSRGSTALHGACYWGQTEVARLLLERGAGPDAVMKDDFLQIRPLGCAVAAPDIPSPSDREENVLEVVELLLTHGADVNGRRKDGLTPLHSAAYRGHLKVIHYLLDHGADPNVTGYTGEGPHSGHTPASVARSQGNLEAAAVLDSGRR